MKIASVTIDVNEGAYIVTAQYHKPMVDGTVKVGEEDVSADWKRVERFQYFLDSLDDVIPRVHGLLRDECDV